MATQEQVQEALARIQQLEQNQANLTAQLQQVEQARLLAEQRATLAEQERSMLIQTVASIRSGAGGAGSQIVDSKGIGQPKALSKQEDFCEWTSKVKTFVQAKYGEEVLPVLNGARQQKRTIVENNPLQSERLIAWSPVYGEEADENDKLENFKKIVSEIYLYLNSFTTGDPNKIVRNSGEGQGLEAWRRLHAEYDPTSSMRRVTILAKVQHPPKVQRIEDLGPALEDWLDLKRQYEQFTDRQGQPCKVSEDSLITAMHPLMPKSLEETVMFKGDEFVRFEDLYDRLSSYASTKASLRHTGSSAGGTHKRNPGDMDIGSFGGGANSGGKGSTNMGNVRCWVCGRMGHYGRDCWHNTQAGGKSTGKGHAGGKPGDKGKPKGKGKGYAGGHGKGKGGSGGKSGDKGKGKSKGGKHGGKKGPGKGKWNANGMDWDEAADGAQWDDWNDSGWEAPDEQGQQWPKPQDDANHGGLDMCALDFGPRKPGYVVDHRGEDWVRFNYDTGATKTALPVEFGQDLELKPAGQFTVASGAEIPNMGRVKVGTSDERRTRRNMHGHVTHVRKPLVSAGEVSGNYDSFRTNKGGTLVPRNSAISREMRRHFHRLLQWHGGDGLIQLYRENNVYNLYAKVEEVSLASLEGHGAAGSTAPHEGGSGSSQGGAAGSSRAPVRETSRLFQRPAQML